MWECGAWGSSREGSAYNPWSGHDRDLAVILRYYASAVCLFCAGFRALWTQSKGSEQGEGHRERMM